MSARRRVESVLRKTFESYGYGEIQTPTFENLELITAKSGAEITGHLYDFVDKSNRKLALRPELSAPTVRLYLNELKMRPKPRKLYYIENCFRYERTQKGRYREFWQAGVELLGSSRPEAEAEVVALTVKCLENLGLKNYGLLIGNRGIFRAIFNHYNIAEAVQNNIFNLLDKENLADLLRYLNTVKMHQEARDFLNLLGARIDNRQNKNVVIGLLELENSLTEKTKKIIKPELDNFKEFLDMLKGFGVVNYEIDFLITRGLDYYTGMVFEIFAEGLGAQNQILGGGTYSLVKVFGGGDVPSCGFGFGFDRLMIALESQGMLPASAAGPRVFVVPESRKMLNRAIEIVSELRKEVSCELELMGRKLGKALSYANSEEIPYVLIVSEDAEGDSVVLKNMRSGEQKTVGLREVIDEVG